MLDSSVEDAAGWMAALALPAGCEMQVRNRGARAVQAKSHELDKQQSRPAHSAALLSSSVLLNARHLSVLGRCTSGGILRCLRHKTSGASLPAPRAPYN
jgi:hypothetical protein